jgi:hypothetical protein
MEQKLKEEIQNTPQDFWYDDGEADMPLKDYLEMTGETLEDINVDGIYKIDPAS